jgi:uncharacterized protein YndB with AHSA1/START domain
MTQITITTRVLAPISTTWNCYTQPEYIIRWNFASPDWCCPRATSDLKVGGRFSSRMEARDDSMGFDFGGVYTDVEINKLIGYTMVDADQEPDENSRKATVNFEAISDNQTKVTISFDPEMTNSLELQQNGWQSILDNFKKIAEQTYQEEVVMMSVNATIAATLI